jgi:hypothetical protein
MTTEVKDLELMRAVCLHLDYNLFPAVHNAWDSLAVKAIQIVRSSDEWIDEEFPTPDGYNYQGRKTIKVSELMEGLSLWPLVD